MDLTSQRLVNRHIFRLLDLPAELREQIYYYASAPFPPIDTASIRNTPDEIRIPAIAQVSQQIRKEALAVFYRNREIHLSFHCDRNVERSRTWLEHWGDDAHLTDVIIFEGLLSRGVANMFHLTLTCLRKDNKTQYQVSMRQYEHQHPEIGKDRTMLEGKVSDYIKKKVERDQESLGEVGKLTKSEMLEIFTLIQRATFWHAPIVRPPREHRTQPSSKRQRRNLPYDGR